MYATLQRRHAVAGAQPRPTFAEKIAHETEVIGQVFAWLQLWIVPDAFETVDVLFVDEAAQMALANVLAVSQAAKTVVLIGERWRR
jgi:uncharacterized protein